MSQEAQIIDSVIKLVEQLLALPIATFLTAFFFQTVNQ